ncbi:MAG: type I glyceraldehyde-3-phosphate dehydrogenase [Gemmatimonadota bacterium]|nr:MAG: type I glyceraldehyde-3-phosphate dehydrogenase [Gemmatimonadota bacterium]
MAIRVAINGFGRIGRLVCRLGAKNSNIELVAINDIADIHTSAHLLKHDSVHGVFDADVRVEDHAIVIDGIPIAYHSEREPEALPWKQMKAELVVEATGIFRKREQLAKHLKAGAEKVILTAPAKDAVDATIVLGVNDAQAKPEYKIFSNASCTTNCLAPVLKVINDRFSIRRGFMTTVHAITNDQRILDVSHADPRRARAASMSIIPTKTGAASAIKLVLPELEGKMEAIAMRVPIADGSNIDVALELDKNTTVDEVNAAFQEAAETDVAHGGLKGILEYSEAPLVSVDIIGNPHSAIFDSLSTRLIGDNFLKIVAWYDNEWGYSNRVVDLIEKVSGEHIVHYPAFQVFENPIEFQECAHWLDTLEGDRCLVSDIIHSMTRNQDLSVDVALKLFSHFGRNKEEYALYVDFVNKRWRVFQEKLKEGKWTFRDIYSRTGIEEYISEKKAPMDSAEDPADEIRHRMETLIKFLDYDKYHIGLTEDRVHYNFLLKANRGVIVDFPSRVYSKFACGQVITEPSSIDFHERQFTAAWDEIPSEWKDKKNVKKWLTKQLDKI